jgi:hypothetical protein
LSKKSLAAFAKPAELFYEFNAPREFDANNPMREATARRGVLTLKLSDEKSPREFRKSSLLVVAGNALWTFSAPFSAGAHVSGRAVENYSGARSEIDVTLPQIARPVFVKLNQRGLFLDKSGWREVPLR